jgi:hypothetical protein
MSTWNSYQEQLEMDTEIYTRTGVALRVYCLTIDWTTGVRSPAEENDFRLAFVSRPAQRLTQPTIQYLPVVFSGSKARPGRDTDHSRHLESRSKMSRR